MNLESILNLNTINELSEILEDEFPELLILFKESSKSNIEQLKIAHAKNSIDDLHKYAHLLKGSSGNLGLTGIYNLMGDIETRLEDKNADVSSLIAELDPIYDATLKALLANNILLE
ncbi:MAG: Hpt domain-containing protein [Gammaproteobacteria bacterium]|nr:Hpt domain-containing protein [Gammaproteobacteria bacterium]